jgi:hypothetical protein
MNSKQGLQTGKHILVARVTVVAVAAVLGKGYAPLPCDRCYRSPWWDVTPTTPMGIP